MIILNDNSNNINYWKYNDNDNNNIDNNYDIIIN